MPRFQKKDVRCCPRSWRRSALRTSRGCSSRRIFPIPKRGGWAPPTCSPGSRSFRKRSGPSPGEPARVDSSVVVPVPHGSRVDDRALAADGKKVKRIAGNLHQHEVRVGVEAGRGPTRSAQVVDPQRTGRTTREVLDAVLRRDALVEMLVSAQDDIQALSNEDRLERRTEARRRKLVPARGVEGMMKEGNLPLGI